MRLFFSAFVLISFLAFGSIAHAVDKGTIVGRVIDESTKNPLPGASVRVKGKSIGAAAKLNGEYRITMEEGKVELSVSYLGYESAIIPVTVSGGQVSNVVISMKPQSIKTGDVIVTALLEGQAKALNQQRTATNIKNVVAADQIGRFPDPNVAEALQRVTGVNIERDEGEGRYVLIRGFSPQYSNTYINGEQIPAPESDIRQVALDAIPADQLASIEVSKSITPDMDGDAIGGSVNLVTRGATSGDFRVTAQAGGEYNALSSKPGYLGSLQFGQRVGEDGAFGYMINTNYLVSQRASHKFEEAVYDFDGTTPAMERLDLASYGIDRNRLGLSGTFDWKPSNGQEFYLRTLYSQLFEVELRSRYRFRGDEIRRENKDRKEDQGVMSFNLGGINTFSGFNADYEVAFARANQDTPYDRQVRFEVEDLETDYNIGDRNRPQFVVRRAGETSAIDFRTDSLYEWAFYENVVTTSRDDLWTGKFNIEIPTEFGDYASSFKFGAKARLRDKFFRTDRADVFEDYEGNESLTLNRFSWNDPISSNLLGGDYTFGNSVAPVAESNSFINFFERNRSDFSRDSIAEVQEKAGTNWNGKENVYAAYLMNRTNFNNLMVLFGVRYEYTSVDYSVSLWDEDNEAVISRQGTGNYSYLLPMLHLKYSLDEYSNIRAAVTSTYSRPNFVDIIGDDGGRIFNREDLEVSLPNFDINPVRALNYDVFYETFLGDLGLLSAGVFFKQIDGFIYNRTRNLDTFFLSGEAIPGVRATQSVNGKTANLFGLEFAWQQNLTYLPGFLSGLSVYLNYTYTRSEATIDDASFFGEDSGEKKIRFPGQANHVGNAQLSYTQGPFTARLSSNFNGSFVSEIIDAQTLEIDNRMQVDFSAQYMIDKNFTVFGEVINLTNQQQYEFFNNVNTPNARELFGLWSRFGLRYSY